MLTHDEKLFNRHEDTQGAFIIAEYSEENVKWIRDAIIL